MGISNKHPDISPEVRKNIDMSDTIGYLGRKTDHADSKI